MLSLMDLIAPVYTILTVLMILYAEEACGNCAVDLGFASIAGYSCLSNRSWNVDIYFIIIY